MRLRGVVLFPSSRAGRLVPVAIAPVKTPLSRISPTYARSVEVTRCRHTFWSRPAASTESPTIHGFHPSGLNFLLTTIHLRLAVPACRRLCPKVLDSGDGQ